MRGKFHLRYVKQKLFLLLLVNVILSITFKIIGLEFNGASLIFILSIMFIFESIVIISTIDFNDFDFRNIKTFKSGAFMGALIMLFLIILKDLVKVFPIIYAVMIALFVITILEKSKKKNNNRWWERVYENEFDEDKINIFWRFNTKFAPKYKGNIERIRFNENLDFGVVFWGLYIFSILSRIEIDGKAIPSIFIIGVMAIYIFIRTKISYCIDKVLNTHVEINGICTGIIERHNKNNPPTYKVSVVDFENKIERVLNVNEGNICMFSEGGEVTLVYGAISKRIVMVY